MPVCAQKQSQDVSCIAKSYASYCYRYCFYAIEHSIRRRRVTEKIARQMWYEHARSVRRRAKSVLCSPRSGATTTIRSDERRESKNRGKDSPVATNPNFHLKIPENHFLTCSFRLSTYYPEISIISRNYLRIHRVTSLYTGHTFVPYSTDQIKMHHQITISSTLFSTLITFLIARYTSMEQR